MLVILTGREQLTVKVDYDQNRTFVYSMEVQKHCIVVKLILSFFLLSYSLNTSEVFFFPNFYNFFFLPGEYVMF